MTTMVISTNLGFPRIGPQRELKRALERWWSGEISEAQLAASASAIRRDNWELQRKLGLDHVPSNDFSLYDHVLDTAVMVDAVPDRYRSHAEVETFDLLTYFAMARGGRVRGSETPALELTKWFDTNYHYLVPEFWPGQRFRLASAKPLEEFREAVELGVRTRPVVLGPVSFLLLGKMREPSSSPLALLPALVGVYEELLAGFAAAGAEWMQIDEPALVLDLDPEVRDAFGPTYARLAEAAPQLRLLVASYFSGLGRNLDAALRLPVAAVHIDLVRGPEQLEPALDEVPESMALSLGVVDGRNVWRADLDAALALLERAAQRLGPERVLVAPSCSLLHVPVDLDLEKELDARLRNWLAFAAQKLREVVVLATGLRHGRDAVAEELQASRVALGSRRDSPWVHEESVARRLAAVTPALQQRRSPYPGRRARQAAVLGLPVLPTTTIGSFPQTPQVRQARARYRRGDLDEAGYRRFLRDEITRAVRFQEQIGLDVLVHGEFERNDMVEHFAELLDGFAVTRHGWVQSYGSRCVKPPIIYGDVARTGPMTVEWASFTQSLTPKPVKGMLTGPVTILQWSFARDDQPREATCRQIALAIRDEVAALEAAGIRIIQIDEPALREGLPLRREEWKAYLDWAVGAFRLASSGVDDETQIHTHMCYSEFNDIIAAIADLDADVIFIEASRSGMELLAAFEDARYPNELGPGVYDIHSPRIPTTSEIVSLLRKALEVCSAEQLWVNPDCGLKTRRWEEVVPALTHLVEAARVVRAEQADQ
ncbi:MAG: 5-methyltetrahydropteroyltriglutamate--homocysteine S-methyltransferase [Egibacteraceae bacterium]